MATVALFVLAQCDTALELKLIMSKQMRMASGSGETKPLLKCETAFFFLFFLFTRKNKASWILEREQFNMGSLAVSLTRALWQPWLH